MTTTARGTILHKLRRSFLGSGEPERKDDELLDSFLTQRDGAAFEALVRRHGPLVLGVCRRVLRNEADAEDAFQATFLVLVRKAATIRPRSMIGNWLYGVAHTTALKARVMNTRRLKREQAAALSQLAPAKEHREHLHDLLDQELKVLPDRYRAVIVLCDLEGKSMKDAARQLGCPLGTVSTRLARGRSLLARRLARHGLVLSGVTMASWLTQEATAAGVPPILMKATVQAATLVMEGQASSCVISAQVAALTQGVIKTMFLTKLKKLCPLLALLVVSGVWACWTFAVWAQDRKPEPRRTARVPSAAKAQASKPGDDAKPAPSIIGTWQGTLKAGVEVRLVFTIAAKPDGGLTATAATAEAGAKGVPFDTVTFENGKLTLALKKADITYTGTLSADGKAIKGQFKEKGNALPLDLSRVDKVEVVKRPQTPAKPYPYREEEVAYENPAARGVKLAGTLTLPEGKGPFPAVLLIPGTGPADRDLSVLGHKPFLVIADGLTRHGIAVLRVDKRGSGRSTGDLAQATPADLATDAEAGVAFLKARQEIDPKKVGLIGISEGAVIAPIVAAKSPDVSFAVLLAGAGLSGEEILMLQGRRIALAAGATEQAVENDAKVRRRLLGLMKTGADAAQLEAALKEELDKLPAEERRAVEEKGLEGVAKAYIRVVAGPGLRYILTYDPRTALRQVKCPVLAVTGEKDVQAPPKENLAEIAKALKEGGNRDVTVKELAGLNHLFQRCQTGALSEYGQIEETFNEGALDLIRDWIKARVK